VLVPSICWHHHVGVNAKLYAWRHHQNVGVDGVLVLVWYKYSTKLAVVGVLVRGVAELECKSGDTDYAVDAVVAVIAVGAARDAVVAVQLMQLLL